MDEPAEIRLNTQDIEVIAADFVAPDRRGVPTAGVHCRSIDAIGRQILEAVVAVAQIDVIWIRHKSPSVAIDSIKALDARQIQRPQDQRIQYAENNCICTDAQGQCDNGNSGKAGRLPHHANGKTEIFCKRLDGGYTSGVAHLLGHAIDAAEVYSRLTLSFRQVRALARLHFAMKLQLVLQVLLGLFPEK